MANTYLENNAKSRVIYWVNNYKGEVIPFKELEEKVYLECDGMPYKETMRVFSKVLEYFGESFCSNLI